MVMRDSWPRFARTGTAPPLGVTPAAALPARSRAARGNEAWYPMTPRCPAVPAGIAALAMRPRAIVWCADYYKNAKKIWASNVLLMNKEKAHMRRCVQWRAFHRTRRHICAGTGWPRTPIAPATPGDSPHRRARVVHARDQAAIYRAAAL
jgi:hypothetical protein